MSAVHDDRPAKAVDDLDNALDKLDEKRDTLREKLLGLGIDYVNKINGSLGGESQTIYQIRDEIFHREGSFRFHIKLLLRIQHDAEITLRSNAENLEVNGLQQSLLTERTARQQFAIFDSVLFHGISLFDYLAGLIQYVITGEEIRKWNWDNVRKAAYHPENPFSETVVGEVVRDVNDFVQNFNSHRASVIHSQADLGGHVLTERIGPAAEERFELKTFAPKDFVQKFDESKRIDESHAITLRFAALWIANETVSGATRIVEALRKYAERNQQVEEGEEVFQFKQSEDD
jgi:hypothetical protein